MKYKLKIVRRSFPLLVNFLLTLILPSLASHIFASTTLSMEVAINIASQSSIIIKSFNHVANKDSSKKVKGELAVQVS